MVSKNWAGQGENLSSGVASRAGLVAGVSAFELATRALSSTGVARSVLLLYRSAQAFALSYRVVSYYTYTGVDVDGLVRY